VLDAMPAKSVIKKKTSFVELGVDCKDNQLQWQIFDQPYIDDKALLPNEVEQGYTTEINLRAMAWIESLSDIVEQGLVLLIDYGMGRDEYFHPQRGEGTLRCYYQHKASDDPFVHVGEQDITTSVNFSDMADQAQNSGFDIAGYATQALFLISLGIDEYLLAETDEDRRITLAQQVKQLVLPSAMGESFKVLALTKKLSVKLKGFTEQDLTHKL